MLSAWTSKHTISASQGCGGEEGGYAVSESLAKAGERLCGPDIGRERFHHRRAKTQEL